jgi:hypothetical protein
MEKVAARKILRKVSEEALKKDLERYRLKALELGAWDVRIIPRRGYDRRTREVKMLIPSAIVLAYHKTALPIHLSQSLQERA